MARSSFCWYWLLLAQVAMAQEGRYAVFFTDKTGTSYSAEAPLEFLSQKSIDRRIKNGVMVSEEDFPVNKSYVSQVGALGADILYTSRWMNAAIVQLDDGELGSISQLAFVASYEYLGPKAVLPGGRARTKKGRKDSGIGVVNQVQLSMLGLDDMHADDIYGQGVAIAVFDSGFPGVDQADAFKAMLDNGQVSYTQDIVGKSGNVYQYDDHGTEVLSIMAASQAGTYLGAAPQATYQLYVTEDVGSEYRIEEYNWLVAAEKADSAGADIIHSSLGYNIFDDPAMDYATSQLDGKTTVVSRAAKTALAKGIFVVVSAGNEGNTSWSLVNPPADVEGVLAVGAVTSMGNRSNFSSVGPTADGRIKPDVVALGSGVSVIKGNGDTGFTSGTSAAAPLATGLVAGLVQAFPTLSVPELYDLVIASGSMFANPDNQKGYGVPNYMQAKIIASGEAPTTTATVCLYPNPVTGDTVKLELKVPIGQSATIAIYNLKGQQVLKTQGNITYSNHPVVLDVSGLGAGLYILKVETEGILRTIRLVKL